MKDSLTVHHAVTQDLGLLGNASVGKITTNATECFPAAAPCQVSPPQLAPPAL